MIVNGAVRRPMGVAPGLGDAFWDPFRERNQLFANDGAGHFRDISPANPALCGTPGVYRALCVGDIDNDGALDLLVTATDAPAKLLRNVAPRPGHWLTVRAIDPELGGRDAYGAEVVVHAAGGRRWHRCINPGYSYLSSNDPRAHFGLGPIRQVERIEITWPDGSTQTFPGCAADEIIVIRKKEAKASGAS